MKCAIEGCEKDVFAKGWCSKHYSANRKYGDPLAVKQIQNHGKTVEERFFLSVDTSGDGCWEWQAGRDTNGYGRLNIKGKPMLAHRVSWAIHCYAITPDLLVLHKCDNPPCVNPKHLFLGNSAINNADKIAKGRDRYGISQGSKHGCAKLNEDQVREIRASADKRIHLAARYGVSRRQIADIQNNKVWRHILPDKEHSK